MSDFKAEHVTRTGSISLNGSIEEVFPLFGPVREGEWAHGWTITVLHAETDLVEEKGAVFTTHLHGDLPTVWVITRYDPDDHRIEYTRLTPDSRAAMVKICCEASGDRTHAQVERDRLGGRRPLGACLQRLHHAGHELRIGRQIVNRFDRDCNRCIS